MGTTTSPSSGESVVDHLRMERASPASTKMLTACNSVGPVEGGLTRTENSPTDPNHYPTDRTSIATWRETVRAFGKRKNPAHSSIDKQPSTKLTHIECWSLCQATRTKHPFLANLRLNVNLTRTRRPGCKGTLQRLSLAGRVGKNNEEFGTSLSVPGQCTLSLWTLRPSTLNSKTKCQSLVVWSAAPRVCVIRDSLGITSVSVLDFCRFFLLRFVGLRSSSLLRLLHCPRTSSWAILKKSLQRLRLWVSFIDWPNFWHDCKPMTT